MTRPASPFALMIAVARVFSRFDRPWFLAGGWAIDLFLQRISRDHEDIDVAVLRRDQSPIQSYFADWNLVKLVQGRQESWRAGERLEPPIHEVHALRTEPAAHLELLFEETTGEDWTYRRDPRITRPSPRSQ